MSKQDNILCMECGKKITRQVQPHGFPKYCSESCRIIRSDRLRKETQKRYRERNYHPPLPRDCYLCGTSFSPRTRTDAKYCTPKCYMRARSIQTNYDITLEKYHELFAEQSGKCAACGVPFDDTTPYVDHDHETGQVRGLLHGPCNSILGFINDDALKLEKLAKYLRGA